MNNTTNTYFGGQMTIIPDIYSEFPTTSKINLTSSANDTHPRNLPQYSSLETEDDYTLVKCDKMLLYF